MGTVAVRSRSLIALTSSKPPMSGMTTSTSRAANSSSSRRRRASVPEHASTRRYPAGERIAESASRFSARSSTIKRLTRISSFSLIVPSRDAAGLSSPAGRRPEVLAEQGEELAGLGGLHHVVGRSGRERMGAIALAGLGGERDDRQLRVLLVRADVPDGLIAV